MAGEVPDVFARIFASWRAGLVARDDLLDTGEPESEDN